MYDVRHKSEKYNSCSRAFVDMVDAFIRCIINEVFGQQSQVIFQTVWCIVYYN